MMNVKRLPGVFFTHKIKSSLILLLLIGIICSLHYWGFVCTDHEIREQIERLCTYYANGEAMGNVCKPLCVQNEIHYTTCAPHRSGNQFTFTAKWNDKLVVFKSSSDKRYSTSLQKLQIYNRSNEFGQHTKPRDKSDVIVPKTIKKITKLEMKRLQPYKVNSHINESRDKKNYKRRKRSKPIDVREANEKRFESIIRDIINKELNVSVTKRQLEALKYLEIKNKFLYSEFSEVRKTEKANVYRLMHSREYVMSHLFSDREMFPQIMGTCGHFYVTEHLKSPQFNSLFMLDDKEEWSERMKLAVEMMDFVEELETSFPDALHLCDIKMSHFGVTNTGRLKYTELDSIYTNSIIERKVNSGKQCREHTDCDFLDCKSLCNSRTNICDGGIVNNNLQVICEKIFVGWTMSGKVILPGLLMSEHTPASLATLLRLCSENGRAAVPEDVRQRLYTTLTEMYQILSQRLSM